MRFWASNRGYSCAVSLVMTVALLFLGSLPTGAQVLEATVRDSIAVRERICDRLLKDIPLAPADRVKARAAIADADRAQWALFPIKTQEQWDALIVLGDRRDAVLRTLIAADSDRVKFNARAAAFRPRPNWP